MGYAQESRVESRILFFLHSHLGLDLGRLLELSLGGSLLAKGFVIQVHDLEAEVTK